MYFCIVFFLQLFSFMVKISHSIWKQILIVLSKQVLFFPMPENMCKKWIKAIKNDPKPSKTIQIDPKTIQNNPKTIHNDPKTIKNECVSTEGLKRLFQVRFPFFQHFWDDRSFIIPLEAISYNIILHSDEVTEISFVYIGGYSGIFRGRGGGSVPV